MACLPLGRLRSERPAAKRSGGGDAPRRHLPPREKGRGDTQWLRSPGCGMEGVEGEAGSGGGGGRCLFTGVKMAAPHVFTNAEMTDMILIYGQCDENSREAARVYAQRFPNRVQPRHQRFPELRDRLRTTGTFAPGRRGEFGFHYNQCVFPEMLPNSQFLAHRNLNRPARGPEAVAVSTRTHPHNSTRKIAGVLGMNHVSVHKIIKTDLGMHPFKRMAVQELLPNDLPRRLQMCQWLLVMVNIYFAHDVMKYRAKNER